MVLSSVLSISVLKSVLPLSCRLGTARAVMLPILLEYKNSCFLIQNKFLPNEYLVSSSDHECAFGMCSKPHGLCRLPIAFLLLPLGFPPPVRNAQPPVKAQATSLTAWQG